MEKIKKSNSLLTLSVLVVLFAVVATLAGLLSRNIYRDSEFIILNWRANDMITLLLAVPMLIISMYYSRKGSQRWYLVWMGLLLYMLYNYSFYLFGAAFNKFFLFYVSIFSLSIYALIIGISSLKIPALNIRFNSGFSTRFIAAYLFLVTLPLLAVESAQCLKFILYEKLPSAPPLIFALDLSLIIPASILAAVLLWRKTQWGYLLAVLMLIKGFVYGIVLSIGTGILAYADVFGKWDRLLPFYIVVAVGGLTGAWILLKKIDNYQVNL